jgi:hypothetical protein
MSFNRFLSNQNNQCSCEPTVIYQKVIPMIGDLSYTLMPSMYGYEFILTSGTTFNVVTNTLTNVSQPQGFFIKIKNGKAQGSPDITLSINGVSSGTLHPRTANNNASPCCLYWDGNTLLFY